MAEQKRRARKRQAVGMDVSPVIIVPAVAGADPERPVPPAASTMSPEVEVPPVATDVNPEIIVPPGDNQGSPERGVPPVVVKVSPQTEARPPADHQASPEQVARPAAVDGVSPVVTDRPPRLARADHVREGDRITSRRPGDGLRARAVWAWRLDPAPCPACRCARPRLLGYSGEALPADLWQELALLSAAGLCVCTMGQVD
jgi:hypothetical protein